MPAGRQISSGNFAAVTVQAMGPNMFSGTLPSATPVVQAMTGAPLPCTVTLKSAAGGRLIELSTDGGVEYFTAPYANTSATALLAVLAAPVSHIRITGTTNDTWSVL